MMVTLDRWRSLLNTPKTIVFPRLELMGRDYEPSIVVGAGEVRMETPSAFAFHLNGTPTNIEYALAEIRRLHENPYDPLARFRLVGVDSDGIEWAGGYTSPVVNTGRPVWTFTGEIDSLSTDDRSEMVSRQACTELIFLLRIGDPMTLAVTGIAMTDQLGGEPCRDHVMEILGSSVRFAYEDSTGTLLITASHSPNVPITYAENWLSEPLRIIFGQLTYPRLVARNFGDGRAFVWVRRSPGDIRGARWAGLLESGGLTQDNSVLWSLYAQLLTLIALARGEDDERNFEPHKVTRLYEEIIQAALGSRWVWALTFASSIEALAKMLISKGAKPTQTKAEAEAETEAIAAIVKHINSGPGEPWRKKIAVDAVHRTREITTIRALRHLKTAGAITETQLSDWNTIRHAVMHGSLISAYSSAEDDRRLLSLAAMMHALTRELLRRSATSLVEQSPQPASTG